jgi:hypothetical protein
LAVAAVVTAAGLLAGCGSSKSCRPNTVFVTFTFSGPAVSADSLLVQTCFDGACGTPGAVPHAPGATTGSLELTFSDYRPGARLDVRVTPSTGGTFMGGRALDPGCSTLSVAVGAAASDGGLDAPATDAGADGGPGGGGDAGDAPAAADARDAADASDAPDAPATPDAPAAADAADAPAGDAPRADAGADTAARDASPEVFDWDAGVCFPSVPATQRELENACTTAVCGSFTTALPLLNPDGTLPVLPP